MKLPGKLTHMKPYRPDEGDCPVRLDANESFLPPPQEMRAEINSALLDVELHRYPDSAAARVCRLASSLYGVRDSQIVAGNGSDELIGLVMSTFVPRGGRVLISDPDFSMYRFYAELLEIQCTALGQADRRHDVEALCAEAARLSPDLIVFSNPCNPSGLGVAREQVQYLLSHVDIPVVVDEAYMDFWNQSILPALDQFENAIVLKTCSKAFGLAGLRLGFSLSSETLADALKKTKSPYNVNALTQAAAAAVLSKPDYLRACAQRIKSATEALYGGLREVAARSGGRLAALPTETNFSLLRCDDAPVWFEALKDRGVLVRLLGPTLLRVTAGADTELSSLLAALDDICQRQETTI